MGETVLLYNFTGDRLKKIKMALLPLKMRIRIVEKPQFLQPLGFLAGIKGYSESPESFEAEGFDDELMLMSGFTNARINELLSSLYRHGLGKIDLKAVITPVNVGWNSIELYNAVKADHEEMNKGN